MSEDANLIEPGAGDGESGAEGGMRLTLDIADVLTFADESHTLCVLGNPGDSLEAAVNAMEELEETAKLFLLLRQEKTRWLTPEQVTKIRKRFPIA